MFYDICLANIIFFIKKYNSEVDYIKESNKEIKKIM